MRISDWSSDVCSSDLLLHLGALWRHDLAVKAGDRAGRHVAQTLFDDLCRLIDFLDADHEAVVAIAAGADGNLEIHRGIGVIRLRLAQIPGDAAAAVQRAGKTPRERVFLAARRDIRSEATTPELQSLIRITVCVFCLQKN